jgi:uncharacterized oligopeptide transporter (OPT) family protein
VAGVLVVAAVVCVSSAVAGEVLQNFKVGHILGGIIRWITDTRGARGAFNEAQRARIENAGVLTASGLIAGEALTGLVKATFQFFEWPIPKIFADPSILAGLVVLAFLAYLMVKIPLSNAGHPDEPAPPTAIM